MRVLAAARVYLLDRLGDPLAAELQDASDRCVRYAAAQERQLRLIAKQADEITDLKSRTHLLEVECHMWRQLNDEDGT